jgi:hypothetical protein
MKTVESETKTNQLEAEITTRQADIKNLREAIATLEAGRIRPIDPKADSAFTLLVELVGAAPENLEQQQIYGAKLEAAKMSLKLAVELCQQKESELKGLKDEARSHEASQLVQQLIGKAEKFNAAIDSSFDLLAEMKTLNSQITQLRGDRISVLTITADLNEIPYCGIASGRVLVGRRFDIKRE